MAVVGPAEVVFDWTTDRCGDWDIPDLPARAFRDDRDQVNLLATHYVNHRWVGPDLDALTHDCAIVMDSVHDADPANYQDYTWLAATYTRDGRVVHALVHDEYHGWEHAGRCAASTEFECWYNAVTLAVSTDGGATFAPAVAPPGHLVATAGQPYEDGAGPYGVFEPSNIVQGPDGAYYAFVRIDEYRSEAQRMCLMRTSDLATPSAWRAWGGVAFDVAFVDPYRGAEGKPCAAIDETQLGHGTSSITFNTYLNRFVSVGISADTIGGREVWGVYYSTSTDLRDWTRRRLLTEVEVSWTWEPGDGDSYLYPSLLDPDSTSRNFETTDRTAYLYLTRFNGGAGASGLDRDLVRFPVEFFPDAQSATAAAVTLDP